MHMKTFKAVTKASPGPTRSVSERTAYVWHRKIQRQYGYAKACAEDLQKKAKRQRSEAQTQKWRELSERLKSVNRLKSRAFFPKRPTTEIEVSEDDDFDAALLPEDSWEPDSESVVERFRTSSTKVHVREPGSGRSRQGTIIPEPSECPNESAVWVYLSTESVLN
ncbi:hypothetical protein ON010_g7289 [Phytophthora cinnamomi]|nr:hypothetical protein ON010_g7289 [Phytophthora cinnamomi]